MSQFDAAARPVFACFQAKSDFIPYRALPRQFDIDQKNSRQTRDGGMKLDFAQEDAVDDLLLNEIVWRSVRGAESVMPATVQPEFVRVEQGDNVNVDAE